ncbi:MAG TPA: AraC family transcriptional regulator [Allosphingosinicella sp.]|nr:AraC family transcriptional regulator [Allosphingosinicella sp.]
MDSTPFFHIDAHGEGARLPFTGGCVVLSDLPGGRSAIRALAPSVKFVLSGEEVYRIDGRTRALRPGRFLLVEAGSDFEVVTPRPERTMGLCVYLSVSPASAAAEEPLGRVIEGGAAEPLSLLLSRYARRLSEQPSAGAALAPRIVADVAGAAETYLASFARRVERLSGVKRTTRVETLQRVERARAFIHEHADRSLTLDDIASQAALSRFHLSRSFAEAYGLPPLAYHRRLRLRGAADVLKSQGASPTELAERLGYASLSAFTRAFRQAFGVPPSRAQ